MSRLLDRLLWLLPHDCPEPVYPTPGQELTEAEYLQVERYLEHGCSRHSVYVGWHGPKWLRQIGCLIVGHRWERGFPGDDDRYCPQCSKVVP